MKSTKLLTTCCFSVVGDTLITAITHLLTHILNFLCVHTGLVWFEAQKEAEREICLEPEDFSIAL
jgi:hypothetical protein